MSFADNLKRIRKDKNMSQEDLAALLDVSRQAVSKWEQGIGYPEVEKLLLLADRLHVSLDSLMAPEIARTDDADHTKITGTIVIVSHNENVISPCCKVISSQKMKGGKNAPQFALMGVGNGHSSSWGEPAALLGWYANREQITEEIHAIGSAIAQGTSTYQHSYSRRHRCC